jgi:Flp pilus assembly protein TadD
MRISTGFLATVLLTAACGAVFAQENDPAYNALSRAFDLLRAHNYDAAIEQFREAARISPLRADIRKNLAYTLLKTGEGEAARLEFGAAMKNDPADFHVALEYAFLCFEAREDAPAHKAEARRIFARLREEREEGDAESRATAAKAFENIDRPLREGIARWQKVLAEAAPTFSVHEELAQLAEARDELDLAASHYRAAFQMQPGRKSVLLELARVEKARGNQPGAAGNSESAAENAMAALLAASRGGEPRAAEMARELLPDRYPYVYEFRQALELDPKNAALHRELAYLLLKMSQQGQASEDEAREEFRKIAEDLPGDYLSAAQLGLLYLSEKRTSTAMPILEKVLASGDAATANRVRMALQMPLVLEEKKEDNQTGASPEASVEDPRILGERSYAAGFLKDARRYFLAARQQNPVDAALALKLGWTYNMLHDDPAALQWFDVARKSDDAAVAAEAARAYNNLRQDLALLRTTVWFYPLYSSRWNDVFGYGQIKTELRWRKLPFHFYASMRLAGDVRRTTGGIEPQSLSESAVIPAVGVATTPWHGAMGWFEAGTMVSYLNGTNSPDYRGGFNYARTKGASLAAEHGGWFFETTADSVYVSHFDHDLINYSQNKLGYTARLLGVTTQTFWNNNITFDLKHEYWADTFETGPGFRFRPPHTPAAMNVTVSGIRGVYLINAGNPRGPNFFDFRVGVWYAFTR